MKKELEDEGDVEKGMFEKFMSFSHRRFAIMFIDTLQCGQRYSQILFWYGC